MNDNQIREKIKPGIKVQIVLKKDQPTGILTTGIVKDILTHSANHHRGIKVRLKDGQIGRVQVILTDDAANTVQKEKSIVVIKKALIDDLYEIQKLHFKLCVQEKNLGNNILNSDFSLSLAGANFFKEKIENEFVYVAKTNGNVIGFVCASKLNNKPWYNKNVAEIISIYVKESYRKKGIGTSLLNKAKDYYNNINIPNILLTMPIKDVSCLEFYKDNDFISCYNTLIYTASYKHI